METGLPLQFMLQKPQEYLPVMKGNNWPRVVRVRGIDARFQLKAQIYN
jgi:hypothetical protein